MLADDADAFAHIPAIAALTRRAREAADTIDRLTSSGEAVAYRTDIFENLPNGKLTRLILDASEVKDPDPDWKPLVYASPREGYVEVPVEHYLVWSNEHNAWWRANSAGYSRSILGAGLYSRDEALSIAATSRDGWRVDRAPDELPVALADIPPEIAAALQSKKPE